MIFRHYRTEENGCATVAFRSEDGLAELGVAWCSPEDPFNRAKGRLIAAGRVETKRDNGHYHSMPHTGDVQLRPTIFAMLDSMKKPRWFEGFIGELEKAWEEKEKE